MEKLTIALVLAFSTVVALGAAHTTIVTTIEDNYPVSKQQECSPQLLGQNLNQCHMYIMKQGENPQQCCQELENMEEECQCEAVKQVLRDAVQQVHQQQQGQQQQDGQEAGWPFSTASEQIQRFQVRANMLGNKCSLSRQCLIRSIATTATTIDNNRKWDWPVSAQECQIQSVNRCQRYVEQHISASPNTPPTSSSRQEQQEYCDAIEKLNRKFIRQPRQQQVGHQGGPFGGQQKCNGEFGRHQSGHFGGQQQQGGEYGQQSAQFGGQQQQGGEFGGHQIGRFGGQQQQDGEFGGNQSGQFGGQQKQGGKFGQQNGQFGGQQQQGGEFGGQFGGQQQTVRNYYRISIN